MIDPRPGEDVFTEEDLAPSEDDRRARRRGLIERAATITAVSALGLWMGGLVALGACAAPLVFELTPYPFSAQAMGAVFARFDGIAIACSLVVLGAEVARTVVALRSRESRGVWSRLRRYLAIALAAGAVYSGLRLTPEILRLHEEGARRGVGEDGAALEALHGQAELIAKIIVPLALVLIALHVATLRAPGEEDEEVFAPLPPGRHR